MRLATIRLDDRTAAVRVDEDAAIELGTDELREFLSRSEWRSDAVAADGPRHSLDSLDYAPPVPRPDKVICIGLNYRKHIEEMGRELPSHPTLFAKFSGALVGAFDDIQLPKLSNQTDWEAELGVVIGAEVRHASVEEAAAAIAGYTVVNDVSARDFQNRTPQWLQGKTFERSTPVGPWIVVDEGPPGSVACLVDGEVVQQADTSDLVFSPTELVSYISRIITLVPGDLISTGTPGGVGHARNPQRYLVEGNELVTRVEGVGELRNICKGES